MEARDAGRAARGPAAQERAGVRAAGDGRDRAGLLGDCVQAALAGGHPARPGRRRAAQHRGCAARTAAHVRERHHVQQRRPRRAHVRALHVRRRDAHARGTCIATQ